MDEIHVRIFGYDDEQYNGRTGLLGPHDSVDFPEYERTVVLDTIEGQRGPREEIGINLNQFSVI